MSIILYPKRSNGKPCSGAQLNRGHNLAANLVGCWLFNEQGGALYDLVGGGDAYLTGSYSRVASPDNSAVLFDGSSGIASIPRHSPFIFGVKDFTLEVIFISQSTATGSWIAKDGPSSRGWLFRTAGSAVSFTPILGGTSLTGIAALSAGKRYHVVVTRTSSGLTSYINGKFDKFQSGGATDFTAATADLTIGGNANLDSYVNSSISLARVWNGRALRPSEISQLYSDPYCLVQPQSPQDRYWQSVTITPRKFFLLTNVRRP